MNEAELRDFLAKQGLVDNKSVFCKLKGGYLNSVWRADTPHLIHRPIGICAKSPLRLIKGTLSFLSSRHAGVRKVLNE